MLIPAPRIRTLLLVAAGLLIAAVSHADDDEPVKLPKWKKGEQEGTVQIDGNEEAFTALVPKGYSTKKTYATVLLLHGNGGKAKSFLNSVAPAAGKKPPLLISLERCDNNQKAEGYTPKYLAELKKQFAIDDELVFCLGFSGGGFRLWDDVVCQAEQLPKFRGVVLIGSARQSFDPPDKPERAPTVILVGDPKDQNYTEAGPAAKKALEDKEYEVIEHLHDAGHSLPRKELEAVFTWIEETCEKDLKARKEQK